MATHNQTGWKVLVTGGAGLVGSHVVDQLLAAGHQPAVVDNFSSGRRSQVPQGVPFYPVDVCDEPELARVFDEFRPEAVCHQAAQISVSRSVREPGFDARVNVLGWLNVLEQAARTGVSRVVFASSGGVLYGDVSEPAAESQPANPMSPYGISKWTGERYLEFYARERGVQAVALRYSNVYGPRQNPEGEAGVVAIFCERMLAGLPATINGDGRYVRDYVLASDVARANVLALTVPLERPFIALNVGTGQGTDVNALEALLRPLCQAARERADLTDLIPSPVFREARAGDLRSNLVDASLARQVLGWQPATALEEGLAQTVEWFAAQS